jgi:hypothetical protein
LRTAITIPLRLISEQLAGHHADARRSGNAITDDAKHATLFQAMAMPEVA